MDHVQRNILLGSANPLYPSFCFRLSTVFFLNHKEQVVKLFLAFKCARVIVTPGGLLRDKNWRHAGGFALMLLRHTSSFRILRIEISKCMSLFTKLLEISKCMSLFTKLLAQGGLLEDG